MDIVTTAIIKGGTGKTTTAAALAQAAAFNDQQVLAIDLDPQANLSMFLGANVNGPGSYELLHGRSLTETLQPTEQRIDVIAASANLADEKTSPGSGNRLVNAIGPYINAYDLIVIDTPPTMGELTYNALNASTGLLIPLETDLACLQGFYQITDIARQIQHHNKNLSKISYIFTRLDVRPKINRELFKIIAAKAKENDVPFLGAVRKGIAVREAQALQRSLFEYARKSKPAQDYLQIYQELKNA